MVKLSIPEEVKTVAETLEKAGFKAYLVGGCVRDLILGKDPKDWDVATDAVPEKVQEIFGEENSVYENQFGTVGVKTESEDSKLKIIEVTTFRLEGKYSDQRHPDEVKIAETIEEDLSRRDFTVNALAMSLDGEIIDPYEGKEDLKKKVIRTVLDPHDRFAEDALRLMRAVRFATELSSHDDPKSDFSAKGGPASGWQIEPKTREAIVKYGRGLEVIAKERVRDELVKILLSPRAAAGIVLLEELGLLQYILPELREGINVGQNKHHIYSVFEHNVRALDYTAKQDYSLEVRLASLLHDVGKPRVKKGDGPDSTFYNHDHVGGKMTLPMLDRLHFPKNFIEHVAHLVRYHLFYYNVGEVTAAGVRRFLARVGPEYIDDLMKVREADRIGSGVPKAVPYKMRHLMFMIEKVKRDPLSPKMLALNGSDVMEILKITPGPKIGQLLAILLEEVLDDPIKNTKQYLEMRIKELADLSEEELKMLSEKAKERKEEFEEGVEKEIKQKHHVQ